MKNTISKPTSDAVVYPLNHRAWASSFTVQNLTDAELTVEVTNEDIQKSNSITWSDPDGSSLLIQPDDVRKINGPYTALNLSGTGTGTVAICELF